MSFFKYFHSEKKMTSWNVVVAVASIWNLHESHDPPPPSHHTPPLLTMDSGLSPSVVLR